MTETAENTLPLVTSAKTADVMNAVMQLRLDITKGLTRSDTLLETIQKTQEIQGKKLDDVIASMTTMKSDNGIMRQQITENKAKLDDHELRLREKTRRMEELDQLHKGQKETRETVDKLAGVIAGFQASQAARDKEQDEKFAEFKSQVWKVIGIGIGIGWMLGILTPLIKGVLLP